MQFIETIQLHCLFGTIFSCIIPEFLFNVEDSGICSLPFYKHKLNPLFFNYAQSGVDLGRPFKINVFALVMLTPVYETANFVPNTQQCKIVVQFYYSIVYVS